MWWNGRHRGLKIPCPNRRAGSTPAIRTSLVNQRSQGFSYAMKKGSISEPCRLFCRLLVYCYLQNITYFYILFVHNSLRLCILRKNTR